MSDPAQIPEHGQLLTIHTLTCNQSPNADQNQPINLKTGGLRYLPDYFVKITNIMLQVNLDYPKTSGKLLFSQFSIYYLPLIPALRGFSFFALWELSI